MPHSFSRWHASLEDRPPLHLPTEPPAVGPEHALLQFAHRLTERQDRDYARLSQAARKYRRVMREIPAGREHRAREFNVSARFLLKASSNPGFKRRLPEFADALTRSGSVVTPPGHPEVRLLCGVYGQPLLAFLPSQGPTSAFRASLSATLEETLRVDHDLSLGIAHPVPHVLPGVGPGHLVPAPGIMSEPQQQAFAGLLRSESGATAQLDRASRKAVRDLSPKALQTLALSRLFTNDWQCAWDRQLVDVHGRCWPLNLGTSFPDDPALLLSLSDMQRLEGQAPLFRIPDDAGPAFDQPLDPALAVKVLDIDTRKLHQSLRQDLAHRHRVAPARTPGETLVAEARHQAVHRAVDAIRVVQTLIKEDPTQSLRWLLQRFPHRLDWLDRRPPRHRDPASTMDRNVAVTRESAPEPTPQAAMATAPQALPPEPLPLGNAELSALLNQASPFNPFKRRDRVLAPLLSHAIGLRLKKAGPKRQRAAEKLRRAAFDGIRTISRGLDPLRQVDPPRVDADNARLRTLRRLIADTEARYGLPRMTQTEAQPEPPKRSWLPWRRGAQREA